MPLPRHHLRPARLMFFCLIVGGLVFSFVCGTIWLGLHIILGAAPFAWYWIPVAGGGFGVILAAQCWRSESILIKEQSVPLAEIRSHSDLIGEFTHNAPLNHWHAELPSPLGANLHLYGGGAFPTKEQLARWVKLQGHFPTLITVCHGLLWPPPETCLHSTKPTLIVESVSILESGEYEINFTDADVSAQIHMWPAALISKEMAVTSASWEP